jgi:GT2 family glycosyltransferase
MEISWKGVCELSDLRFEQDIKPKDDMEAEIAFCDKIPNKRVLIYMPTSSELIPAQTMEGIFELLWDCAKWQRHGFEFLPVLGKRLVLPNARTMAVETAREYGCGYILWIDDDMVIMPGSNTFSRLLLRDKDIVAPLFFTRLAPFIPCLYRRVMRSGNRFTTFENILDYEPDSLVKVDGVGFGCVLTKMSVFEKVRPPWFLYGDGFGEDLYFCQKAIDSGIEIYCDTTFDVGHVSPPNIITHGAFETYRGAAEEYQRQRIASEEELAKEWDMSCDIVMPCYKNYETTRKCVESILNFTDNVKINLILVNDGNDKKLAEYFSRLSKTRDNIKIITNRENVGWIRAVNQGIKLANTAFVLIANNDIEIFPEYKFWLERMIGELIYDKQAGATGPVSNYVMGLQSVAMNDTLGQGGVHYSKLLIGFCMLVRKKILDSIGGMDERFCPYGNDDLDLSLSIRKGNYRLKVIRDVFVFHEGTKSLPLVSDVEFEDKRTRKILIEKWGNEAVEDLFKVDNKFLTTGE